VNHPDTASTTELQNTAASLFLSCPFSGQVRSVASGRVVNGFLGNDWVGPSDLMNIKPCKKKRGDPSRYGEVLAFLYRYLELDPEKIEKS
jgi:hypothetical protein